MLCTNCTEPVKPLVAFDLDGTLGDYHRHLSNFMLRYWGAGKLQTQLFAWDGVGEFEDYFGLTKAEYRQAKLAFRQGGWKRWMPAFPGAARLVDNIRGRADVWIATSRPWQRLDNIDPDTVEWLQRNGITVDGLVYGDDKYERLVGSIDRRRIVAVVDDLYEQCELAAELGLMAVQRSNAANQTRPWRTRCSDLSEVELLVNGLLDQWEAENERDYDR